ncbi:hypothetical protein [Actinotalea sp. K2]|nr:hypothetical protein [Actinotalea sp. K2]MCL3862867.1 hypothetical protein [Actinotalea sp. K2]
MSESTNTQPEGDQVTDAPNPETGVGIGAGEPSTFEPEEDTESVPDEPRD